MSYHRKPSSTPGRLLRRGLCGSVLALMMGAYAQAADLTVAYFPGWPTTHQVGEEKGWFNEAVGMDVQFREFDTGAAMAAAMLSGDVQVAYSMGVIPFVIAVTQGAPLDLVGVAVTYSENDNCVVRNGSGIASPLDLKGKTVGVPFGTVSHYKMLKTFENVGVDVGTMKVVDMAPPDVAAAMTRGDVDLGCGWEPALSSMLKNGELLVSAKEQESWGLKVFDVIVVNRDFAKQNPEKISAFLSTVDRSTDFYQANAAEATAIISKKAGISEEQTRSIMAKFGFPKREEQLSQAWLGKDVPAFLKGVADVMVANGEMDKALDDYSPYVKAGYYTDTTAP
ncbi:ABC transporter substrate-binding protein [Pseudomonas lalucatii]|uniref:ABC transporter substrate-binding protein n=1 Tax=Pseudomonas lalucatii TaxID=1424203 RepID=A0ABS5PZK2_9PSED|nr:ABC transporter substrate-binding protein [Pseudomonas lalucatii]MBS7661809.1 ABC transporter substrate-binding protein [Pseudomonas lalucatii]MBS7690629.1 ABC transporter substrate-binding protein [Pseudomonas lalucatii]MBS7726272.1 ABC transporter substrate-binding protein [Pseudomonas lalucatii]QVM88155.1 ABC transporter substrate-binding protein [Pseudomonas lalucatii]